MNLHFERSGGFAGIGLKRDLNSEVLPAEDKKKLQDLVEAADFFELPEVIRAHDPGADRFQYKITVDSNQQKHTVQLDEAAMPEKLRPLLQWLTAAARKPGL